MKMWTTSGAGAAMLVIAALGSFTSGSAEEGKDVKQMITAAKTPADHQAIATFYREESARLQREAARHAELAKWWASLAGGQTQAASARYEQTEHCRRFADLLEKAAQEAQALAKGHESMTQPAAGSEQ